MFEENFYRNVIHFFQIKRHLKTVLLLKQFASMIKCQRSYKKCKHMQMITVHFPVRDEEILANSIKELPTTMIHLKCWHSSKRFLRAVSVLFNVDVIQDMAIKFQCTHF